MKTAEFSIYLQVNDVPRLIQAARERAIEDGITGDMEGASEIIVDDDIALALRMILDPGQPPPGCEILDSCCELGEVNA